MSAEILIVGESSQRRGLISKVKSCGYEVILCDAAHVSQETLASISPAAVIVCMEDGESATALARIRRSRSGAALPVLLYADLDHVEYDLADLLDLGADHILGESGSVDDLRRSLWDLAGAPDSRAAQENASSPLLGDSGLWSDQADLLDGEEEQAAPAPEAEQKRTGTVSPQSDVVLAQEGTDIFDFELTHLGLDAVPDVQPEGDEFGADDPHTHLGLTEARTNFSESSDAKAPIREATVGVALDGPATNRHKDPDRETKILQKPRSDARRGDDLHPWTDPGVAIARESTQAVDAHRETRIVRESANGEPMRQDNSYAASDGGDATFTSHARISDTQFARLLLDLHERDFSGVLEVQAHGARKALLIKHGNVVGASSDDPSDRLSYYLQTCGWLTSHQAQQLEVWEDESDFARIEPALGYLATCRWLKAGEYRKIAREHLRHIAAGIFGWESGGWRLRGSDLAEQPGDQSVSLPDLAVYGVHRYAGDASIARWLFGHALSLEWQHADPITAIAELARCAEVDDRELHWLLQCDGARPLAALGLSPAELGDAGRWCYLLWIRGDVSLPTAPPSAVSWGENAALDRARILSRLDIARAQDPFALLGLPNTASPASIRQAARLQLATFASGGVDEHVAQELQSELEELRTSIENARDFLCDNELRSGYQAIRK